MLLFILEDILTDCLLSFVPLLNRKLTLSTKSSCTETQKEIGIIIGRDLLVNVAVSKHKAGEYFNLIISVAMLEAVVAYKSIKPKETERGYVSNFHERSQCRLQLLIVIYVQIMQ